MKRPLGMVAVLYGIGLLLGEYVQPPLPVLLSGSLLIASVALWQRRLLPILLWALIPSAAWTSMVVRTTALSPFDLRTIQGNVAEWITVRGELIEVSSSSRPSRDGGGPAQVRSVATIRLNSIQKLSVWQPAVGRIIALVPGEFSGGFHPGVQVETAGIVSIPAGPLAEGLFDYCSYLRRQGIYYQLKTQSTNDWRLLGAPGRVPWKESFMAWARSALGRGLPDQDQTLRLEWSLSLGDKTVLTEAVAEPFVRASTYHIFAVDGLRMSILFGILFSLCRAAHLPRAICGLLLIPVVWIYTGFTGWPASAIRASVMLTVIIAGWSLRRPADLVNSLFTAALIILIWDPQQLFQAGFQLSFVVVLSIVLTLPILRQVCDRWLSADPLLPERLRQRRPAILRVPARYVLELFLTSTAAWIGSIPLVAYYFHIVTPVSAPANIVAVPLCALVLVSNFACLLLAPWCPAAAQLFNHSGWFLMECIRGSSVWFAQWPCAWFYVAAPGLLGMGLYYLLLWSSTTGWLFSRLGSAWKITGLILLGTLWCWGWLRQCSNCRLHILPLNGGSAIYVDAPGHRNDLLVDCGNDNAVQFVLKPFLRAQGANRLPAVVLTHGDLRQIGGAESLVSQMPVDCVATSSARFRSKVYRQILSRLEKEPGLHRTVTRLDRIGDWTVLHPEASDDSAQADDSALVLFGRIQGTRVLLLSDLGVLGQGVLLQRERKLQADILVAGLSQESASVSEAFLDIVRPQLLVITDAKFPATRRAGAALRERLEKRGIPVLYTGAGGAICITARSDEWEARTMDGTIIRGHAAR